VPGIEPRTSVSAARNSDHETTEAVRNREHSDKVRLMMMDCVFYTSETALHNTDQVIDVTVRKEH
jgi:hypothetical protein